MKSGTSDRFAELSRLSKPHHYAAQQLEGDCFAHGALNINLKSTTNASSCAWNLIMNGQPVAEVPCINTALAPNTFYRPNRAQ